MDDDLSFPSETADMWELAMFVARENAALRSFLEYLQSEIDTPEIRAEKLNHWQREVGLQLGNPGLDESTKTLFRTIRDAPIEVRQEALRQVLAQLQKKYLDPE